MAPIQYEYVEDWLKTFDADVLMFAIRRAVDQGVPKWAYVNQTLVAWQKCGAKTLEDCEAQVVQFERNKEGGNAKHKGNLEFGRDQKESEFAFLDQQNRTGTR
ncbi:Replication initiation and membrane attachment [compost metagenome]